jgi:light-regulated signal transduction histidine kinase (bacteriophytochrome)
MNLELLASLRTFCRDEAAFDRVKEIVSGEIQSLEQEIDRARIRGEEQQTLFQTIWRLREPLDLNTIFTATATEVRQLLSADRVGMFRFHPDTGFNDGEFVSEDVDPDFPSALAQKIHDHCFGNQFAIHYQVGRVQNVADIYDAGLSDCHIQILSQFQVRANLVVPLLQSSRLWGLLCIHQCRAPRQWQDTEVEFVTRIANHLGVALHHAELMAELRTEVIERQQAEQRAAELNRGLQQAILEVQTVNQELESFSYSVSHDLRAPLRGIDGFSQALLEDYQDRLDATGKDYLYRIRAATQRMGQLIDDMLVLSRVTRTDMHKESIDLSQLVSRICADLQATEPARQVEFTIQAGSIVSGDARLLQIVLDNLLNNAWKFTSQQPQAQIEFGEFLSPHGLPVYFIRDNGVGFDMSFVDKLFRPFQRLHGMNEFPGNGIGLATVQRIIHRHGGRVWTESALAQGTTFYFTLTEGEVAT